MTYKTSDKSVNRPIIVLVSGVSGAGKSSVLKAFEDFGFEAIDNVPLKLLERLTAPGDLPNAMAIGVDIRTRDFTSRLLLDQLETLTGRADADVRLLFVDCDDLILGRRFEETRRRHPLAIDRPIADGIRHERRLVHPLRQRADLLIDTTELALGDMKRLLSGHFKLQTENGLSLFITSFSFRSGLPRDADLVFDVRFLKNPHYDDLLKPLTGRDQAVADYINTDTRFENFFNHLTAMLNTLIEGYEAEGKSYLTIAFGCTGGRHRSVFCAEQLTAVLRQDKPSVQVHHRDLDKPVK